MRETEVKYWTEVSNTKTNGSVSDNIWKRKEIMRRLCALDLIGRHVIEIGCGLGTAFGAMRMVTLGHVNYLGTDLSPVYVKEIKKNFGLQAVQADVTKIPVEDGRFDYCVCLDSLEHVRPEDRAAGYLEISRILKTENSMVVINIPLEETFHDNEFDHGFYDEDLFALLKATKMRLYNYETYQVECKDGPRAYAWAQCVR